MKENPKASTRRSLSANAAMAGNALALAPLTGAFDLSKYKTSNNYQSKTPMKPRKLGKLEVPEIGLGCMNTP